MARKTEEIRQHFIEHLKIFIDRNQNDYESNQQDATI
jgi:hypothetical protein